MPGVRGILGTTSASIKAVGLPVKRRAALPYSERWLAKPADAVAEIPRNGLLTFTVATPDAGHSRRRGHTRFRPP